MNSSNLILHPKLCPRNFWDKSCESPNCSMLHIRRPGRMLALFNTCANLHRINRKIGKGLLSTMRMPEDCELYVVDSQIDPEDFGSSINFQSRNIFIAHAIGLHPSTGAPMEYFDEFTRHLRVLDQRHDFAYVGPFGGCPEIKAPNCCDATEMTASFSSDRDHPRATAVGNRDELLLQAPRHPELRGPVLFLSVGRNSTLQLGSAHTQLTTNHKTFLSFNGESLRSSYPTRNLLMRTISKDHGRRCVLETCSTAVRHATCNDLLPLAVVNIIVDLYVKLMEESSFRALHYSLAEFNTHFNENGFKLVPLTCFQVYHTGAALNAMNTAIKDTLGNLYERFRRDISYGRVAQPPRSTPIPWESRPQSREAHSATEHRGTATSSHQNRPQTLASTRGPTPLQRSATVQPSLVNPALDWTQLVSANPTIAKFITDAMVASLAQAAPAQPPSSGGAAWCSTPDPANATPPSTTQVSLDPLTYNELNQTLLLDDEMSLIIDLTAYQSDQSLCSETHALTNATNATSAVAPIQNLAPSPRPVLKRQLAVCLDRLTEAQLATTRHFGGSATQAPPLSVDPETASQVPTKPVPASPALAQPVPAKPVPAHPAPAIPVPAHPVPAGLAASTTRVSTSSITVTPINRKRKQTPSGGQENLQKQPRLSTPTTKLASKPPGTPPTSKSE